MMPENTYLTKLRSVGVLKGGRTRPRVDEGRDETGHRTKAVTDELGNTVTEHDDKNDRVDVTVRPPMVHMEGTRHHGG